MAALTKFDITGKHAIVTGGAQGLSRGMAEGLLEAGCKVVIIDVQKEKVEKVCEEYRAKGLEAYPVIGNLADRADLNRAFDEALQILDGRLDVLIPAAGIQRRYLPEEFPAEQWDLVMKINLDHVWFMIQRSLQVMLKQETGGNFIEYLTEIRLKNARELLKDSRLSIKEICVESGYSDPNYFSRIFKKYEGVTPSEFRERLR